MKRLLVAILISMPALAEDVPAAPLVTTACGADNVKFKVQSKGRQPQSPPPWLSLQPAFDKLTAAPAQTYYFRARVLENHGYFTSDLDPINSDEGQFLVSTSAASDFVLKK